jgi:HAD superfamily hydrolase (TIGR01549 family)
MRPVRAVLFDLDDTLFDHQQCARAALVGVRDGHPCFAGVDQNQLEASHARILEDLHLEVMAGRIQLDAARIERFRRLYAWAGIDAEPTLAARAAAAYREGYLKARMEVRGASALLAAVQPHAKIVVVSNNLLEEQREKIRHCGLDRYVDVLVTSEEAGVSKPDPAIFQLALERAQVAADEAVMLGDSWGNDIEGARAAGIRAIWFNRSGEPSPDPDVPAIDSLEPAVEVLRVVLDDVGATRVRASVLPR